MLIVNENDLEKISIIFNLIGILTTLVNHFEQRIPDNVGTALLLFTRLLYV